MMLKTNFTLYSRHLKRKNKINFFIFIFKQEERKERQLSTPQKEI